MVSHNAEETKFSADVWRGRAAWHMSLEDILIGQRLGFSYVMSGDHRPGGA